MGKASDLQNRSIADLDLSPKVSAALSAIQAELAEGYRTSFVAMVDAMRKQASALERIQTTLHILIQHTAPHLVAQVPAAIGMVDDPNNADVATAVVIADPIGKGYTLSKSDLAEALGLPDAADIGVLTRAFELENDPICAVVVRTGKPGRRATLVNFHPRAIERFRELLEKPPAGLDRNQKSAVNRVRQKLKGAAPPNYNP